MLDFNELAETEVSLEAFQLGLQVGVLGTQSGIDQPVDRSYRGAMNSNPIGGQTDEDIESWKPILERETMFA